MILKALDGSEWFRMRHHLVLQASELSHESDVINFASSGTPCTGGALSPTLTIILRCVLILRFSLPFFARTFRT